MNIVKKYIDRAFANRNTMRLGKKRKESVYIHKTYFYEVKQEKNARQRNAIFLLYYGFHRGRYLYIPIYHIDGWKDYLLNRR